MHRAHHKIIGLVASLGILVGCGRYADDESRRSGRASALGGEKTFVTARIDAGTSSVGDLAAVPNSCAFVEPTPGLPPDVEIPPNEEPKLEPVNESGICSGGDDTSGEVGVGKIETTPSYALLAEDKFWKTLGRTKTHTAHVYLKAHYQAPGGLLGAEVEGQHEVKIETKVEHKLTYTADAVRDSVVGGVAQVKGTLKCFLSISKNEDTFVGHVEHASTGFTLETFLLGKGGVTTGKKWNMGDKEVNEAGFEFLYHTKEAQPGERVDFACPHPTEDDWKKLHQGFQELLSSGWAVVVKGEAPRCECTVFRNPNLECQYKRTWDGAWYGYETHVESRVAISVNFYDTRAVGSEQACKDTAVIPDAHATLLVACEAATPPQYKPGDRCGTPPTIWYTDRRVVSSFDCRNPPINSKSVNCRLFPGSGR